MSSTRCNSFSSNKKANELLPAQEDTRRAHSTEDQGEKCDSQTNELSDWQPQNQCSYDADAPHVDESALASIGSFIFQEDCSIAEAASTDFVKQQAQSSSSAALRLQTVQPIPSIEREEPRQNSNARGDEETRRSLEVQTDSSRMQFDDRHGQGEWQLNNLLDEWSSDNASEALGNLARELRVQSTLAKIGENTNQNESSIAEARSMELEEHQALQSKATSFLEVGNLMFDVRAREPRLIAKASVDERENVGPSNLRSCATKRFITCESSDKTDRLSTAPSSSAALPLSEIQNVDEPPSSSSGLPNKKRRQLYQCDGCDCCSKDSPRQHLSTHTGERPFTRDSSDCDRSSGRKSTHSVKKKNTCDTSTKRFKKFTCCTCGEKFAEEKTLDEHVLVHVKDYFSCNICKKIFSTSEFLATHMSTHYVKEVFVCDACSANFSTSESLATHLKTHTVKEVFVCHACSAKFSTREDLTIHSNTHTVEEVFVCDICGNIFLTRKDLTIHSDTHTGEVFICDTCGEEFSTSEYLAIHRNSHTVKKWPTCAICDKPFSTNEYLATHMETHDGEKRVKCSLCGKNVTRAYLKRHLKVHDQ